MRSSISRFPRDTPALCTVQYTTSSVANASFAREGMLKTTVRVRCGNLECGEVFRVDSRHIGKTTNCGKCKQRFELQPIDDAASSRSSRDIPAIKSAEVSAKETAEPAQTRDEQSPLAADQVQTVVNTGASGTFTSAMPECLGRYEIQERLGAGAFGAVYRAFDPKLKRHAAIKVPRPETLNSKRHVERFLREAEAAAQLQHPNIVSIYDADQQDEYHYIASAFVDGETLESAVNSEETIDFRRAAEIVRQLADALNYAHDNGVVHRDVKPANVMLDGEGRPMLMDFGLARIESGESRLTQEGAILGTPAYMSPEQAAGDIDQVSAASDQYSLGVLLYELLCGATPFGGTPEILIYNVVSQEPPPPSEHRADIPPALETICLKAMSKERFDRFGSCGELANDLQNWLDGQPIVARPVSPLQRPFRQLRRNWRTVAGIVGGGVLVGLLVIVVSSFLSGRQSGTGTKGVDVGSISIDLSAIKQPDTPLNDIPEMKTIEPRWEPLADDDTARIRAHRALAIEGIEERYWHETIQAIMRKYKPSRTGSPRPNAPAVNLALSTIPERFILRASLSKIRVDNGKTWLYVGREKQSPSTSYTSMLYGSVVVEFSSADVARLMADYSKDDAIRIVVERGDWGDAENMPTTHNSAAKAIFGAGSDDMRVFLPRRYGGIVVSWCFRGLGVEKVGQPETWVSTEHGRAARLANLQEMMRDPGFLNRMLYDIPETGGRLKARFTGIGSTSRPAELDLKIEDTRDGALSIDARLTGEMMLGEFLDYKDGDEVFVAVTLSAAQPTTSMSDSRLRGGSSYSYMGMTYSEEQVKRIAANAPRYPFLTGSIDVDLVQIQKVNSPSTLVRASGPRRHVSHGGEITPDVAFSTPKSVLGETVQWKGKLYQLVQFEGETHAVVDISDSKIGLGRFEVYTTEKNFLAKVTDYIDAAGGNRSGNDTVMVEGVISKSDSTAFRLDDDVPLLKLVSLERNQVPSSKAAVGVQRDPATIDESRVVTGLAEALRNRPAIGSEITFDGVYSSFSDSSHRMSVRSSNRSALYANFEFAEAQENDFADYKSGDEVTVTAVVLNNELTTSSTQMEFRCKQIVRRKNARSLITEKGRAIPPLDFSVQERQWEELRKAPEANAGKQVSAVGIFDGFSTGSNQGKEYRKVTIKRAFNSYRTLEVYCAADPKTDEFLSGLKSQAEVLFEFVIADTPGSQLGGHLVWMSPIGDPDSKVMFTPTALSTD